MSARFQKFALGLRRGTTADKVRKGDYANLMLHQWIGRPFGSVRHFERDGPNTTQRWIKFDSHRYVQCMLKEGENP
jgi:hypothetical protein